MRSLRYILIIGCLFSLVACGQKGDLYFPDEKSAASGSRAGETLLVSYGLF